jgi:hypothetical protein
VPAPPPRISIILRQMAQLLEYNDRDSLDTISDFLALRLELLSARDAVH